MSSTPLNALQSKSAAPLPLQAQQAKAPAPAAASKPVAAPPKAAAAPSSKVALGAGAGKPDSALYSSAGIVGVAANNGVVTAGGGRITVDIEASDSGYENKIYYSTDGFKTKHYIGVDNGGGSIDVGQLQAGTKIEFGIDNGRGDFFRSGGADKNADGVDHARTSRTSDGGTRIGFEDLRGGGDRDYNDAVIKVRETPVVPAAPAAAPKVEPAPVNTPAPATNRSGLADGTNPGRGAQHTSSANPGTLNPNNAVKPAAVGAPVKVAEPAAASRAAAAPKSAAAVTTYQQIAGLAAASSNAPDKKAANATLARA